MGPHDTIANISNQLGTYKNLQPASLILWPTYEKEHIALNLDALFRDAKTRLAYGA